MTRFSLHKRECTEERYIFVLMGTKDIFTVFQSHLLYRENIEIYGGMISIIFITCKSIRTVQTDALLILSNTWLNIHILVLLRLECHSFILHYQGLY